MLLNPTSSNFKIILPTDLIPQEFIDAYNSQFINGKSLPFSNILDYLYESIQSVSIPDAAIEMLEQNTSNGSISQLSLDDDVDIFDKAINITFRIHDGYLNYFMLRHVLMWQIAQRAITKAIKPTLQQPLILRLFASNNEPTYQIVHTAVNFNSISGLQLSYDANLREFKTFDCGFVYNGFSLDTNFDTDEL
jgi:hypothetical protein